ncbi:MAG: hypothetical protein KKC29_02265 [Alphaproteobacteria bacterium]|jgi:fibronectin-binding autotransporter adhesin|nr:hypothetical protein [Alphaproteobacteria bacterium]MBU2041098.1 hypothetical protein [Alphaproteobacteria bacterium]MBU2125460.1 hypothetical protein [Alphaproteobacteria bacterium]MBU2208180.1 hypothetical protein [Alphaproteobacteria bacterium]MBU2289911.1 hypothetical protein [Alphaproteobacteria bacterium]
MVSKISNGAARATVNARDGESFDAPRRIRVGLLASTALIAASLAVSTAVAQTVVSPAGGGTIARTGGSNPTVNDQSGSGGGVQLTNVTQSTQTNVTGVTINNTTGAPSSDALRVVGSTSGLNSTGVTLAGLNTLTTTVNGGSALYVTTNANLGVGITSSGSTFTGSYGINLQAPSGYISFDASGQSLSFVANGTHVAGFNAVSGVNAGIQLGTSTISGFDTGINASNFFGSFIEMTGGSINALVTGIRADATGGRSNIQSQAAIVAPIGIHSTNTDGADVTTSGAGTINSNVAGTGTGIIAASSGGTAAVNVTVGAAIGNLTAFATGVNATNAGAGIVSVTNTAAITATGSAIYSSSAATTGNVLNLNADVTGGGLAAVYTVGQGYTINVGAASTVTGSGTNSRTLIMTSGDGVVVNAGTIRNLSGDANSAIQFGQAGTVTNTGTISYVGNQLGAIYANTGLSVTNSGTISSTGAQQVAIYSGGAGTHATSVTNQAGGSIVGLIGLFNTGTGINTLDLQAGSSTGGVRSFAGGATTANLAGTLVGAYDAAVGAGATTLTLASTGSITGAVTFGSGNDVFNWQGGTIGSTINAGTGSNDVFNSALGTGISGSLNLSNLSNFDSYNHQSGNLTLTGARATGPGWNLVPGSSLTLDGSLTVTTGTGYGITMNGNGSPATVSILSGATLNAFVGVWFNTGGANTFNNAGTVTGSNTGLLTNGALTATNTGTITAGTDAAFGTGFGLSTMTNSGILTGGSNATTGFGVFSQYAGVTVTNNAGTISGGAGGISSGSVFGATTYGGLLSVTNASGARISGAVAIATGGSSSLTLNNSGRVLGSANGGIVAAGSGAVSITNNLSGQIVASGGNAISTIGTATITNAGLIGNGSVDGGGVYTAAGTNYAINIAGGTITNSGTITGGGAGIYSSNGLNLTNTGTITGGAGGGVLFRDGVAVLNAPSTILNAGTISAPDFSAVLIQGGTITNAAAGTLTGGSDSIAGVAVQFSATGGTFTNYGSATGAGAGAVRVNTPGAATTTNLHAGSTTGAILLNSGNDTLAIYSGRGSSSLATVDGASGITLQNAGTLGAAVFGTADLGGGTNTLSLRGTGDGTAANGTAGTYNLSGGSVIGASILDKLDAGTWTLTGNGAGYTTINAGDGGGNDGLLILNGTGLTAGITINGATVRAMTVAALGTGLITMINPTLQFGATGTYTNAISLAAADPVNDPTNLQTFGTGITATLSGAITQATAGQPLVFSSVDANGVANTGTFVLTNTGNSWTGQTRIQAGTTLQGLTTTISGGSILNNGALVFSQGSAGSFSTAISGTGSFRMTAGGAVTLLGTNTFTGGTTVDGFSNLLIGNGGTTGSITGSINLVNSNVWFNRNDGYVNSSTITGNAGSQVFLTGLLTLNGSITGAQVVAQGPAITLGGVVSGASASAVNLTSGAVTVAATGSILGGNFFGVRANALSGVIHNFGSITNTGTGGDNAVGAGIGVVATSGSTIINNGSVSNATALISGRNAGINHVVNSTGTLTVNNYATITGDLYHAIEGQSGSGALSVNNFLGGSINGLGNAGGGDGVSNGSSAQLTIVNAGSITGRSSGVSSNGAAVITNSGAISGGGQGIYSSGVLTLTNSGTIHQTSGGGTAVTLVNGGSILNNTGGLIAGFDRGVRLVSGAATITNAGSITGGFNDAIYAGGALTLINTGALTSNSYSGVYLAAGGSITNAGAITGGSSAGQGYGVVVNSSAATLITNQSGGLITGGIGSILLSGAGSTTIDLQVGSTVNGTILSTASGTQNMTVAGALNGAYDASTGTGVDNITLASTGSMTSAALGGGNDSFLYQGGAFSGLIDGGTGADAFTSNLGAASRTLSLTSIQGFETFAHQSGQLTLNDVGTFSGGASVAGGTLLVDGVLFADTLVGNGAVLGGTGTINGAVTIADGGVLSGVQGGDLAISSLNLSSGSIVNATFSGAGGPALFSIAGDLTLDGTLNVASSGAYGFGVYGLMTYGGLLSDNGLTLGTTPGGAQRMSVQTSVAGQVNVVHAPTTLLFWDGGNAGQHDNGAVNGGAGVWTAAGSEWTDANGLFNGSMEPQPGFAVFQGAGGLITVDDVAGAVGVTGMQFAADGYSVQGDSITLAAVTTTIRVGDGTLAGAGWTTVIGSELTGAGQLALTDLGTLILTGANSYTGGTSIDTGRLQIGAGGTTGSILGPVSLTNNGSLVFARSDNPVFSNAVSGNGTVVINGEVTLTGPITATNGVNLGAGSTATLSDVRLASGTAVTLGGANATLNVASGGVVQSLNGTGVFVTAANGFINNLGAISGSGTAVLANGDLTLTNGASGSISGLFGVSAAQNLYLTNNGSIAATVTNFNNSGIYAGGTGTILNTGSIVSGTNAIYTQGAGAVTNSGLIRGGGNASTIRLFGANSTVTNQAGGEITTAGSGTGVYLDGTGGTVVNAGTIRGAQAVNFLAAGGTLTNSGILIGISGSGVIGTGGAVTNLAGGSITGQLSGVTFVTAAGSVNNAGTIVGTTAHGVNLNAGGVVDNSGSISGAVVGVRSLAGLTLTSSGSISGGGNAVESVGAFNDTLTFLAGSTTTGSVLTDNGDDLISLAGGLTGSVAAGLGADTVTLFTTGSFSGLLDGGDGVDAFVLDGAGAGTVDISTVLNFESRTMQGPGVFTLTGADASSTGWAINAGVLAASGGLAIGDDVTVTIGANGTLALLDSEAIGSLAGSGAVNLGSNTLGVVNGGAYGGVIGGSGGLTLIGGALTLSGATTYTGVTDIQGGALVLGASDVLSDLTGVNVATGAILDLGAFNDTVGILALSGTLNGTGTLTAGEYQLNGATVNANLGAGNLFQLSGVSTLNGTSGSQQVNVAGGTLNLGASDRLSDTATVVVGSGAVLGLNAINDTVGLLGLSGTLNGTGTLTAGEYQLNGATVNANLGAGNLFQVSGVSALNGTSASQAVSIAGGTLALGASDRLSDTATVVVGSGAILNLGAFNDTVGLLGLSGTLNGTGTLTAGEYQLNGATVNANLGAGNLFQVSGISTLNGTSGSEAVTVAGGTLVLGASDRLSDTATLLVGTNGALDIGGFNEAVGIAGLSGTLDGTGTLTAGEYQLNGATVNANLGAGNLFQVSGVSTLNGTSASEAVTISGGTLSLGASDRLSDTATVMVGSGAVLSLNAFNDAVGLLGLSGTLDGTGTLTAGEYQLNGATVNANLGAGNLFQVSGVSTLNGTSASEAVTIAGGTLALGASDRLSDTATLVVGADGTLTLGAFDETVGIAGLSGALDGTGTLTAGEYQLNGATVNANLGAGNLFQVSGVSTLNGTSASGAVSIVGGTLALGASNRLSDTATVVVGSGAVLDLSAFNDTVGLFGLSGTLNGTGTLTATETQLSGATVNGNLAGDRLFNLAGESILNGTAAQNLVSVQAGALRLGASERLSDAATVSVSEGATLAVGAWMERIGSLYGMGDVTVGAAGRLTLTGAESAFGGRLSGTGSVLHAGGLFTLVGDHTISNIINQAGELRFVGSTTGAVSVTGGTLTGAGTIGGALTVSNGAVLSPGLADQFNGIGGFTVGGLSLTGGRLNIDVTGTAAGSLIDQIRVLGAATLTGGTVMPTFQGPASGFDFSTRYLFLQAGSLVGTFANGQAFTAAAQDGLFWRVRYDLAPNGAVLELRQLTDFDPGETGTVNQRAVGVAFSGGQLEASDDYAAVLSVIAGLSGAERNAAFNSASGEALAGLTTSLFSANDQFMRTVQASGGRSEEDAGSLSFASQLSLSSDHASPASQLAGVLNAYDPGAPMTSANGGWVSVFTGDQALEGKTPGQATVDSRHSGFAGGYGVSNGPWSLGGAAGVTRMEGEVVARASSYEADLTHAAGYVSYDDGQWTADVTASVFGGATDTRRIVAVGPFTGAAFGDTHAEGQAIAASVARRFRFEDDGTVALGVVGTASNASVDGFTETGAGALSLTAAGLERDWQTLNFSARATQPYRVNGRTMKVYGGLGVMLTTGDRQAAGDMRFSGAPTGFGAFTIEGAETPPLAGVADFGLEIEAADGVSISAGYRGLFSDRLRDNQVGMKLNLRW